jgi:hypothetical protein
VVALAILWLSTLVPEEDQFITSMWVVICAVWAILAGVFWCHVAFALWLTRDEEADRDETDASISDEPAQARPRCRGSAGSPLSPG